MAETNKTLAINLAANDVPQFVENRSKDWVYYGEENTLPDELLDARYKSATHNAILDMKSDMIAGQGLEVEWAGETVEAQRLLSKLIRNPNPIYDGNELLERLANDQVTFGGMALQVIPNRLGTGPGAIYAVDFSRLRIDKNGLCFHYSEDWSQGSQSPEKTNYQQLPKYNPSKFEGIIYLSDYRPGRRFAYPLPDYIGAMADIKLQGHIANFNLSAVLNGMWLGTVINFNGGQPATETEATAIENKVKKYLQGDDNAAKALINFLDPGEGGVSVEHLTPPGFATLFLEGAEAARNNIITAHRLPSPSLIGVKETGQLGAYANEHAHALKQFQGTYIQPIQDRIAATLTQILQPLGLMGFLRIAKQELVLTPEQERAKMTVMTPSEIRELFELPITKQEEGAADSLTAEQKAQRSFASAADTLRAYAQAVFRREMAPEAAVAQLGALYGYSPAEARALVGEPGPKLGPDGQPITEATPAPLPSQVAMRLEKEKEETKLLAAFEACGEPADRFTVLEEFFPETWADALAKEDELSLRVKLRENLTDLEAEILSILKENEGLPPSEIARALKKDLRSVVTAYERLQTRGLIGESGVITEEGSDELGTPEERIEVMYEYAPRLGEPPIIEGTRDFCRRLINLKRLYRRGDIDRLNNEFGTDVFLYRGGWLTLDNGAHRPSCRHIWRQVLVRLQG